MRRTLILTITTGAALLAAPSALAGSLPPEGTWIFDGTTKGVASSQFYMNSTAGAGDIYAVSFIVGGKCGKQSDSIFAVAVPTQNNIHIAVKANGTFSTKWFKTVGDATGEKGKAKIKGTFTGTTVKGTITARQTGSAFGKCSANRKKFKSTGKQIA